MFHLFLPSATKLRRLCFYICLSFSSHGGGCYPSMHCRWYPSMPCSRSLGGLVPGGACSGGGGLLWGGLLGGGCACSGGVPAPEGGVETPPKVDCYCCGRYTSYWNAFLLFYCWLVQRQLIHLSDIFEVKHRGQKSSFFANDIM